MLGLVYYQMGRYSESVRLFEEILGDNPNNTDVMTHYVSYDYSLVRLGLCLIFQRYNINGTNFTAPRPQLDNICLFGMNVDLKPNKTDRN